MRSQVEPRHGLRRLVSAAVVVGIGALLVAPCFAVEPVRLGTRDRINHVELEVHEATGHLFALVRFEAPTTSQYGWEVHVSMDGGDTWSLSLSRVWNQRPRVATATVVGNYFYLVVEEEGPASGLVDIWRVDAVTGLADTDFGLFTVVSVGAGNLKSAVLFGNTDASDSTLYLALIQGDGQLRFFYALTAMFDIGGASAEDFTEYRAGSGGTGVTDADWRLDGAFSAGGSSPYAIFVSYFNRAGDLCVWRLSQTAHEATVVTLDASSNDHCRVAADRDVVVVISTESDGGLRHIRVDRSVDAGGVWQGGRLELSTGPLSYGAPTVVGRWGRGMMIAYHRMGTGGDALVSRRRPVEENLWSAAEAITGIGLRTGTRTDLQPLVAGGWGALIVSDTDAPQAAYFLRLPLLFADGFDSGTVGLWSAAAGL